MTLPFDGLSGGSDFRNSKSKDKKQKKNPKAYYVYKYSKGIPLAEQVIIGNTSVFLQIDIDRKPVISVRLDLSRDHGIILLPQKDGLEGIASYTLPIRFRDLTEIKDFIDSARHETIDSIYVQHKKLWEKFVVTNEEHTISFLAIDSVYSHFQDLFETTHSDLIDGAPGSGKGAILITFQLLGYRVVLAADLSGANILDLYGSNGRCQITLAEDAFRGKPGRLDISAGDGRIQTKSLTFDKDIIKKVGKTFETVTKIEILENGESSATEQRNSSEYEDIRENDESNRVDQVGKDKIEGSSNRIEPDEKIEKLHNSHTDDTNTVETENASDIAESTISKNSAYGHTTSNSVAQLQEQHKHDDVNEIRFSCSSGMRQASQMLRQKPTIYRIGRTDRFGCASCNITADRWAMEDHLCRSGSKMKTSFDQGMNTLESYQ